MTGASRRMARTSAAAVVVSIAFLAGCTFTRETTEPGAGALASTGTPTLDARDRSMENDEALVDDAGSEAWVEAWDEDSRTAALDAARAAMVAWARPDLPFERWWAQLAPGLSPQAQEVLRWTDPGNIPVRAIGDPAMAFDESVWVAWVVFDTDAGNWWVLVSRQPDSSWLVERITATDPLEEPR